MNRIIGHGEEQVDQLLANPLNFRLHPDNQQQALAGAIDDIGFIRSVTVNQRTGRVVDGHLRVTLAARSGVDKLPVEYVDLDEAEEAQALLSLDPIAAMAASDKAKLDELMRAVQSDDERVQAMISEIAEREGMAYAEGETLPDVEHKSLSERFIVPPFSVLDARQGYWQERKRAWISLGIMSELGRGECITWTGDALTEPGLNYYRNRADNNGLLGISKQARSHYGTLGAVAPNEGGENGILTRTGKYGNKSKGLATSYSSQDRLVALQKTGNSRAVDYGTAGNVSEQSGTSIFDPVLCELIYRWFMPVQGSVLDPFAGGSVRGIVASKLGHKYRGIDLSARQIEANRAQADELLTENKPDWIVGDSKHINKLAQGEYDLIFSCPPYADLEVYSDDPNDLSNMDYPDFKSAYHEIIYSAVAMLKQDRFACFVVGDVRDKKGFYRNFVSDTIEAFQDAGATLYNEAILVTAVGSLPIRAGKQFSSYRKLGKTHQNILVFYKGDPRKIKEFGEVEAGDLSEYVDSLSN